MRKAPEDILSFAAFIDEVSHALLCLAQFLMMCCRSVQPSTCGQTEEDTAYHLPLIRSKLSRNIASVYPDVQDKNADVFQTLMPTKDSGMRMVTVGAQV